MFLGFFAAPHDPREDHGRNHASAEEFAETLINGDYLCYYVTHHVSYFVVFCREVELQFNLLFLLLVGILEELARGQISVFKALSKKFSHFSFVEFA